MRLWQRALALFGRRSVERADRLVVAASGKRSREKCGTRQGNERYELSMVSTTRARGDVKYAYREPKRWASRRARGVQQRAAGGLMETHAGEIGRMLTGCPRKPAPRCGRGAADDTVTSAGLSSSVASKESPLASDVGREQ